MVPLATCSAVPTNFSKNPLLISSTRPKVSAFVTSDPANCAARAPMIVLVAVIRSCAIGRMTDTIWKNAALNAVKNGSCSSFRNSVVCSFRSMIPSVNSCAAGVSFASAAANSSDPGSLNPSLIAFPTPENAIFIAIPPWISDPSTGPRTASDAAADAAAVPSTNRLAARDPTALTRPPTAVSRSCPPIHRFWNALDDAMAS